MYIYSNLLCKLNFNLYTVQNNFNSTLRFSTNKDNYVSTFFQFFFLLFFIARIKWTYHSSSNTGTELCVSPIRPNARKICRDKLCYLLFQKKNWGRMVYLLPFLEILVHGTNLLPEMGTNR